VHVAGMNDAAQTVPTSTTPTPNLWRIDPVHSSVGFSVRHLMVTQLHGVFERFTGTIGYDPQRPEATRVNVSIETASVYTREPQRDAHLRSADFFDVEKYPVLTFSSQSARRSESGSLEVKGNLTLHGITKPLTLVVCEISDVQRDLQGARRIGGHVRAKLKRSDFGMTFNKLLEAGNVAVSDEVALSIDVSLVAAS